MKNIQKYILSALFATLLPVSCTKDFESINTNPNAPEQAPATNLLLSGISNGFFQTLGLHSFGGGEFLSIAELWSQHLAMIQYNQNDKYETIPAIFGSQWGGTYQTALKDLQTLIADPENGPNIRAAAMVMRAWLFSVLTDLYGEIPYSQALDVTRYVQPAYDAQESIYKNLTAQLAQAASMFDPAGDATGEGDVLYNGDILKWKKFANTLRARLLNRYKHLDAQAKQDLISLLNDPANFPVFESNADDATLIPTGELPYVAPLYRDKHINGRNDHAVSATFVNVLKNLNDPRLPVYAEPNVHGEFAGHKNGDDQPASFDEVSAIGTYFRDDPVAPLPALAYPEFLFIKAEALLETNAGEAKQAYLEGIEQAMNALHVAPTPEALAAADAAWTANPLDAIITQKWIGLFLNGPESFTEFRRTGYPSAIQTALNAPHPELGVPRRYAYPPIEETANGASLHAAQARQHIVPGLEIFGDKMWWAK